MRSHRSNRMFVSRSQTSLEKCYNRSHFANFLLLVAVVAVVSLFLVAVVAVVSLILGKLFHSPEPPGIPSRALEVVVTSTSRDAPDTIVDQVRQISRPFDSLDDVEF